MKKLKNLFWGEGKMKNRSPVFIIMIVLSAVALITSNVLAGKSFSIFGWQIGEAGLVLTCGVLVFPVTYILCGSRPSLRRLSRLNGVGAKLYFDIMLTASRLNSSGYGLYMLYVRNPAST